MKKEILEALKNKYKNLGFTDKAFDGVADFLAKTVTKQEEIDNAIGGVEDLLKAFQGDADKRVNDAVEKAKKEPGKGAEPEKKEEPEKKTDVPDDTPAWAKTLIEDNRKMSEKIIALETGKTTDTRKGKLAEVLSSFSDAYKKTVEKNYARMAFATDEDFNTYLEDVKTDGAEHQQTEANTGLGSVTKPAQSGSSSVKAVSKDDAVVKGVMNAI